MNDTSQSISAAQRLALFNYWFEHDGHWMFGVNGREKAMQVWRTAGIEGLPQAPDATPDYWRVVANQHPVVAI